MWLSWKWLVNCQLFFCCTRALFAQDMANPDIVQRPVCESYREVVSVLGEHHPENVASGNQLSLPRPNLVTALVLERPAGTTRSSAIVTFDASQSLLVLEIVGDNKDKMTTRYERKATCNSGVVQAISYVAGGSGETVLNHISQESEVTREPKGLKVAIKVKVARIRSDLSKVDARAASYFFRTK